MPARHVDRGAPAMDGYFVLLLLELLPLGDAEPLTLPLPDTLPEGDVELLLLLAGGVVVVDDELEPVDVVVSDERGVVAVPGEADGLVRSGGVVVTLSVSVRLQAVMAPPTSASAQRPESSLFIAHAPPCGVLRPSPVGATPMPSAAVGLTPPDSFTTTASYGLIRCPAIHEKETAR